jgi:glucan phosphoethanolaminetransferase (alkaline phosphatase superfamily)
VIPLRFSSLSRARLAFGAALLVILPLLPSAFQAVHSYRFNPTASLADLAFPFAVHLGICTILFALTGRIRPILFFLIPAAALGVLETFYIAQFGTPSGPHVYGVIADTYTDEVRSWLGPWLLPLVLAAVALLALLCWAALQCWRANWMWHGRTRAWALAAATTLGLSLYVTEAILDKQVKPFLLPDHFYFLNPLSPPPSGLRAKFENSFPWGLPWRVWRFSEHWQALQAHQARIASFQFGVRQAIAAPVAARQVYLLVIGETGRIANWGLYGARRGTTPLLSARTDLTIFADATSAASATRESVSMMLTRRAPSAMLEPTGEPSVVTLFRQAGFKTYWFSTQGTAGTHETPISVMAREANEVEFINGADYKGAGALDGQLLPRLQRTLARVEPKQFIVLHTLGSHLNYAHRYPAAFERFRPALQASDRPDLWSAEHKAEMINAYDNSVLYTDSVLNQVIDMVAASGAVATVLYVADHGESLFDGDCSKAGHGFAAAVNYRVPMVAWTSPAWQAWRPEAAASLKLRSKQAVSTLSVFPTLAGLAGLAIPAAHAHPDLSSDTPRTAARMVTHYGDFDRNIASKSCEAN